MKCLIIDNVDKHIAEELGQYMSVDTLLLPDKEKLISVIAEYDALIMRVDPHIDREVLEAAKNLKFIGVCSVGLDHIDMEAAKEKGVAVHNAPGMNSNAVAELTICKMLELSRDTITANHDVKVLHQWDKYKFMGRELRGKTIGILGFGRIGQRVGFLARAFGMKVLAYDPYLPAHVFEEQEATSMGIYEVLHNADYVTIHVPLTEETRNLVCKEQIAQMKDGAMVLNMSRGGICNEQDVYEALVSGKLGGYGADVMENELAENKEEFVSPLFNCDKFVISPHAGAQTVDAAYDIGQLIIADCKKTLGIA